MSTPAFPLVFYREDGTELELSLTRLDDGDIESLDEWLRSRMIESARKSLGPDATPRERDETIGIAIERAMGTSWMSPTGAKIMATIDGMTRILWQATRKNHPKLLLEELRKLILDPVNLEQVNVYMRRQADEREAAVHTHVKKGSRGPKKKSIKRSSQHTGGSQSK